jgi:hypothetical protein
MSGAAKALLVIGAVVVVLFGGCAALIVVAVDKGADKLNEAADDLTPSADGCPFLSADAARRSIADDTELLEIRGLASLAGFALDTRALPDAPSCMFSSQRGDGPLGRVARLKSGDARDVFQAELTKARGITEDRGNGISVESDSYFSKDVDLGDEAFCTTAGATVMSGVLVRRGDTVVYVSLLPDQGQLDDIGVDSSGTKLSFDDENCERAQAIARAVLDD